MKPGKYTARIEAQKAKLLARCEAGLPEPSYD